MLFLIFRKAGRFSYVFMSHYLYFFVLHAGLSLLLYNCDLFESYEMMKMSNREYCLRVPPDSSEAEGDISVMEEAAEEPEPEGEAYILCRQCHQAITRPADRTTVQGAHRHTFANPHGIVFEIGCFRNVEGCGYAGAASNEFTWFAGYSWRVCFCRMCLTHLGWVFNSGGGDVFHGLILDRLIEPG
jgi:hypothetical protein